MHDTRHDYFSAQKKDIVILLETQEVWSGGMYNWKKPTLQTSAVIFANN